MISFTQDESTLIECLRDGAKSVDEVAAATGRTRDTLRVIVHRINKKTGTETVRIEMKAGRSTYSLAGDIGDYTILSGVQETMGEVANMNHETNWKLVALYVLGSITLAVLAYLVGYYQASLSGGVNLSADKSTLKQIFQEACK